MCCTPNHRTLFGLVEARACVFFWGCMIIMIKSPVCLQVFFVGCWSLEEQNEQTLFEGTNHAWFGSQWKFPEFILKTSGIMRKSWKKSGNMWHTAITAKIVDINCSLAHWLVVLTMLKNDGVRQWVPDDIPYMKWKIIQPCLKPPTRIVHKFRVKNSWDHFPATSHGSVSKPCTPGEHQNSW